MFKVNNKEEYIAILRSKKHRLLSGSLLVNPPILQDLHSYWASPLPGKIVISYDKAFKCLK